MAVWEARPMTELATATTAAEAFEDFFEAERGRLFGAVYLMTGSVDEAEEIAQDAFLAVWERWDRVRQMERSTGYLYRVAMNRLRSRRRHLACAARRGLPFRSSEDPYEAVDLHDEVVVVPVGDGEGLVLEADDEVARVGTPDDVVGHHVVHPVGVVQLER